jgi:Flp pilus assembly pilin Flp
VQETTNDTGPMTHEAGQTATEYTFVLLLVAIVSATALTLLNDPFGGLVTKVVTKLTDAI